LQGDSAAFLFFLFPFFLVRDRCDDQARFSEVSAAVLAADAAAKMKFRKMHGVILLDRLHQHAPHAVLRCVL
jgi:hypothetical protein